MRRLFFVLALIGFQMSGCRIAHADCQVTKDQYTAVKMGMTVKEVEQILGCAGEEMSSSEFAGLKTIMLMWTGAGFGNMNAMFQNDALMNKAQFGLK